MLAYVVRRVLYAIPILIGINLITFVLFFVVNTPDDMARMQLGAKRVTPEAIEKWKAERGYDKPLLWNARASGTGKATETIFYEKSVRLFAFDFGTAEDRRDIGHEIRTRMWPSLAFAIPTFLVGLAVNQFLVRKFLSLGEDLLLRVPVVKTVYSAIRDMTRLVNTDKKKGDLDRVVTVDVGLGKLIGFVTQEHANTLGIGGGDDLVAVYLPMSYQIGGYTVYLPRSKVTETDLTVEQAMRIVLTGGVRGR